MWHANDKKSVGRSSPADYEGKRCSAVSYSTGKLGKQQPVFAFGRFFRDNGESVFLISIFEQLFYS